MRKFWFPILILLILGAATYFSVKEAFNLYNHSDFYPVMAFLSTCVFVVFVITWAVIFCTSMIRIAELQAFNDKTKEAYQITFQKTKDLQLKAIHELAGQEKGIVSLGEMAYEHLSKNAVSRLRELRNKISYYNDTLAKYRAWNNFVFTRGFVADVPDGLDFLSIDGNK